MATEEEIEQPRKHAPARRKKTHTAPARARKSAPPAPLAAEQEGVPEPAARGYLESDFDEGDGAVDSDIERC
jgi:hypothetical protein